MKVMHFNRGPVALQYDLYGVLAAVATLLHLFCIKMTR